MKIDVIKIPLGDLIGQNRIFAERFRDQDGQYAAENADIKWREIIEEICRETDMVQWHEEVELGDDEVLDIRNKIFRSIMESAAQKFDVVVQTVCEECGLTVHDLGITTTEEGRHIDDLNKAAVAADILKGKLTARQQRILVGRYQHELVGYPNDPHLMVSILLRMHDVLAGEAMAAEPHFAEDEEIIKRLREGGLSALGCEF